MPSGHAIDSRISKKRKAPTSSDAPAGFSLENLGGFDYEAAVKQLKNAKFLKIREKSKRMFLTIARPCIAFVGINFW